MFFIRTQRSGVHFGGHRRWPTAGQASSFRRQRAVAALPLTTDAGTGAALLAQPAPLIASGIQLRSGRGRPWVFGGLGALSLGYGPDHVAEDAAAPRCVHGEMVPLSAQDWRKIGRNHGTPLKCRQQLIAIG